MGPKIGGLCKCSQERETRGTYTYQFRVCYEKTLVFKDCFGKESGDIFLTQF